MMRSLPEAGRCTPWRLPAHGGRFSICALNTATLRVQRIDHIDKKKDERRNGY